MRLPVRSIFVSAIAIFLISLVLTATGVIAAPGIVSDFFSEITGIKESAIKAIIDPTTSKIPLKLLPAGHNSGLDADLLDGEHGSFYAKSTDLSSLSTEIDDLTTTVSSLSGTGGVTNITVVNGVTKLNTLTGDLTLTAGAGLTLSSSGTAITLSTSAVPYSSLSLADSIKNADISSSSAIAYAKLSLGNSILSTDILDGTLANADISSSAAISYSKLNLSSSIGGGDLSSGINITSSGNIVLTGSGALTSAGAISAPTATNSINGLIINSGALSGITTIALSGALSGATTITGSGNINTTGGSLQTNGVIRIDNFGAGTLSSLSLTTPLTVANGGTGAVTFTTGGVLTGNGTGAIQVTSAGTAGQVLTSNGAGVAPTFQAVANLYNFLTNPGFEIWQRGAGPFSGNVYSADRWIGALGSSSTISVTKESTDVDTDSVFSAKLVYTHVNQTQWQQILENPKYFKGRAITLSVRVKASTANAVRLAVYQHIGTESIQAASSYHTGDGTWQTLTTTAYTVPTNIVALGFSIVLDATATVFVDNATFVLGSTAQTYYPLHPEEDMARAERYYWVVNGTAAGVWVTQGASDRAMTEKRRYNFPTRMAVVPTITKNGTWGVANAGQPTVLEADVSGFTLQSAITAAGTYYYYMDSTDDSITAEANP